MPIHLALALSLVESVALAGLLHAWAERVAGARLLVLFLLGVAAWIVGNELPFWAGPAAERPALTLFGTAALSSAVFLHFTLSFCGRRPPRRATAAIYGVALAAALASAAASPGRFVPWPGLGPIAVPNALGWTLGLIWAGLAGLGQLVLLDGFARARGIERRRIAAVIAASAWGLACMSGYAVAALGIDMLPWPLVGLPLYPVILVYGILRYRVLVADAWARRALTWTLLVAAAGLTAGGAGALASALAPRLPFAEAGWASGAVAAAAVLVLGGPARRLAERVVYPGRTLSAEDLRGWRAALGRIDAPDALVAEAARLLSVRLGLPVAVRLDGRGPPPSTPAPPEALEPGTPALALARDGTGDGTRDGTRDGTAWTCRLDGWDAAPPGPRRTAAIFADLLAAEAARVDGLEAAREREREAGDRARLAELGAIAAAVAHDLRNPLNNIGMALALAAPELRADVGAEVSRIARLADDLLDYAKPWQVRGVRVDLAARAAGCRARWPALELGAGVAAGLAGRGGPPVVALADPDRLDQALGNLVDNALALGGRVGIDAELDGASARLHVYDDGPGVPDEIRARLFQPFVSRRPGGTGLGLAIVAKIVAAHGGRVDLTERPGWTTCFTLSFPAAA